MKDLVYQFIKQNSLGVVSTINMANQPESALIGIAVSINLEIIFDTVKTSRKYNNLVNTPNVSLVIGWDNETTLQMKAQPKFWKTAVMLKI